MAERSKAPWTLWQVNNLKKRQADKTKHEYTCAMCSKELEPTVDGWRCKTHGLIKFSWAHKEDAEGF